MKTHTIRVSPEQLDLLAKAGAAGDVPILTREQLEQVVEIWRAICPNMKKNYFKQLRSFDRDFPPIILTKITLEQWLLLKDSPLTGRGFAQLLNKIGDRDCVKVSEKVQKAVLFFIEKYKHFLKNEDSTNSIADSGAME